MINFTPFESLLYLYITVIIILPCIVLCFFKKRFRLLNLLISVIMTVLVFGVHSLQIIQFLLFLIYEIILVYIYLFFKRKCKSEFIYYLIFMLSIIPIFFVRICSLKNGISQFIGFTGISYMCFKIWKLLIDIHDDRIQSINILYLVELLVFFPSFSSGPIISYTELNNKYQDDLSNYFDLYFKKGLRKIILGLFYKFALAYLVNKFLIGGISDQRTILNIIKYMYSYTLYLFFDFAGYSNMAIGTGYLMGIKMPENFNKPFLACHMKEFWQRWHMSLSNWFNENIFNRFVLNNVRNGLFKNTKNAARVGYLVTMLLMGLWHGFSLHYVIYGLYEGILLLLTDYLLKTKLYRKFKTKKYYKFVSIVICFQFISFGMLLFSGKYFFVK